MKKIGRHLSAAYLLSILTLEAQIPLDTWRTHYSYQESYELTSHHHSLYSRAQHSILSYHLPSGRLEVVSAAQKGLHNAPISHIQGLNNGLLIGYTDGRIELFKEHQILSTSTLERSSLALEKTIYTSFEAENKYYVGGAFGLLALDKKSLRFIESYLELGKKANAVAVRAIEVFEDSLFLATDEGLIWTALRPKDHLLDPSRWRRPTQRRERNIFTDSSSRVSLCAIYAPFRQYIVCV